MKLTVFLALVIGGLSLSQPLLANSLALGVIAGVGESELTADSCELDREFFVRDTGGLPFSCNTDETDTAIGINLSYHFNSTWALELGYLDLGQTSSTLMSDFPDTFFVATGTNQAPSETIDAAVMYFAANVSFQLAENWSITGRLGFGRVETDLVSRLFEVEINNEDPTVMLGVALNYSFSKEWSAHLRYDQFPYDYSYSEVVEDFEFDSSIDLATLGITYTF